MSDKENAALTLAQMHFRYEPGMREIYRVIDVDADEQDPQEPIKLLEVNADTIPSGVLPLGFDPIPASGNFPSVIIQITPAEFTKIQCGELHLPQGWQISKSPLPPPPAEQREAI